MNRLRIVLFFIIVIVGLLWLPVDRPAVTGAETASGTPLAYVLNVDGSINPALSDYILKGIEEAKEQNASVIVITMDTPGGVVTTTKTIIKAMIQCPIPVVVYVAPGGSSATSAGALITMGADIAAMAPGTNIGAAHPVGGGGQEINKTMSGKILNDLTAYMRGIVGKRGRNVKWVEKAIRESVSVTATEALKLNVIDVLADSMPDLLNKIDGRKVEKEGKTVTLKTKGAVTKKFATGLRFKILDVVANPNIAYLLLMGGMLGLMIEFYNPGLIFPGVLGGICLLLALFASQVLPVNYVGILLLILGVILFIMEVKIASFGLLSIAGIICLTLGSVMLFETGETAIKVSWTVIVPTVGLTSAFFIFAMGLAARAWMAKPRTGEQGLIGEVGEASTDISREGKVYVHGEYWNARAESHIPRGDRVRVIRIDNLFLVVTRDSAA